MNTIYRTIWNAVTQTWVAAPENAKGRGKGSKGSSLLRYTVSGATVLAVLGITPAPAQTINGGQTVTVPGSQNSPWNFSGALTVGDTSSGTLTITSGGSVSSGSGFIGRHVGGIGLVTVSGAGAQLTSGPGLSVGAEGNGTLEIANGGRVTSTTNSYIGVALNSTGKVTVNGDGSQWNTNGFLRVGQTGNGTLEITGGGIVSNALGSVGYDTTGTGTVSVSGWGSRWTNSSELSVGTSGIGRLDITNSGAVSDTAGTIGSGAKSRGTVTVDGVGSTWTNSGTLTVGNFGNGALTISNNGAVSAVSARVAANSGSQGVINFGAAATDPAVAPGTLTLTGTTPTLTLGTAGSLVFNHTDNSGSFEFSPGITGAGKVGVYGGTTVLTGDNTYTGGTTIYGGTLQLGNGGSTGAVAGDVADNGTLVFSRSDTMTVGGAISGTGSVQQIGPGMTVLTGPNTYSGGTAIDHGTLAVTGSAADSSSNLGSGGVSIAAGATLAANTAGAFTFNNNLSGAGTLQASSGNQTFSFGSEAGSAFAGTAALSDNTFDLSGNNTTAMTNATLRTEAGNVTTVGDGNQNIGGLTFNGGKVVFDARVPDQQQASSMITVNALDASGPGTVAITVPQPYTPSAPSTPNATNLLAQDDAGVWTKLVNATSTTGSAGAIALVDQNGNVVSAGREVDIAQGGNVVTKGTYDYRLTTAPNDGLYVNYGLKQLDLQSGQTLTLAEDTGATGAAADMSAKITGTGNLAVNAGAGAVSLSNATNDYEGETTVASGTLRLGANNALGSTTVLHIANGAATDVNGKTQTIQQLDGQAGSALNINGGTLTIANGGTSAGSLTGAGTLNLAGGVLDVQGANAGLSASTSIAAGAIAKLNDAQGLGTGAIVDDGKLVLNTATDWTLANAVSGTGDLVKQGAGTLTAGDALTYTGKTAVDAGTLILGDATQPNVILGGIGAGTVSVAQGATLAGLGTVSGQVVNAGTVAALNALPGHEGDAAGTFTLANGMVNGGTVNLAGASVGNQLVVKGDYVGNNGQVVLSTVKGDDNSATDKLVLDGGRASGNTDLVIKHAGGNGAQTTQGIRVVETRNGATTDATAFALSQASDGYRAGVGTIAAGPYDYSLARGGNGGVANDWYLSSVGTTCETNGKVCPPAPIPGPTPDTPVTPTQDDGTLTSSYRPEVGAYLNNRLFAQTMQFHTLHERQSQAPGMVGKDLNASSDANAWVRVMGKTGSREGALSATDTSYLVHAGGDILRFRVGDEGSLRLGAMGAYGSSHNRADNGSLSARGTVDGYNAGVYGTWYGNKDILSGPYVDSWVMYGRFNNQVNGQGLPSESYKSSNLAASLEAGYSFPIYESGKTRMFIEPQGQVIVSDYRADTHTERNGTVVSGQSGTSTTTRLGVRLHGDVKDETGVKQMRPFAEVNWWHGPGSQTASFDGVVVRDDLPADRIEGKIGLQGNVTKAVSVWGSVGFEAGARDYTAGKAQVGVRYSW